MNHNAIVSALLLLTLRVAAAEGPVRINAQSTKPMKDICEQISNLFHWRITYEDAPVFDMREVVQERAPSGVPWLRMRAVPLSFDVPPMLDESVAEYRRKVLDAAMGAYGRSGNRAAFRYSDDGDYIHVVPSVVAGPDGRPQTFKSILDVPVTIKVDRYTIRGLVEAVLAQVGKRAGVTVSLGTIPNSFKQIMLTEEAENELAREFLMRVFERQNGARYMAGVPPERLFWRLNYTADGPQYFFNVGIVPTELDAGAVSRKSRQVDPPAESPDSTGDSQKKAGFINKAGTSPDQTKHK